MVGVNDDLHGDAKFSSLEDTQKAGLFADAGIELGVVRFKRRVEVKPEPQPQRRGLLGALVGDSPQPTRYVDEVVARPVRYTGDRHVITIAPSRSGKGRDVIIPTLLTYEGSVLVIDPKGQNAAVTARRRREMGHEVIVINPFGLHTGPPWNLPQHGFNPLAALDPTGSGFVADVSDLCESLIVSDTQQPHWGDSARDLISALVMDMVTRKGGEPATLARMRQMLTLPPKKFDERLIEMAASPEPFVRQRATRFIVTGPESREVQSILSTAVTQTNFLDDPAIAASLNGNDLSMADLKRKPMSVFLVLPSRYMNAYSRFLRLFVVTAVSSFLTAPAGDEKPVLVIMDEFASLGHLAAIESAMALAAGFGVRLWPILQDLNQVVDVYKQRWQTFLANAGVVQFFTPGDAMTADHLSRRLGTFTRRVVTSSQSDVSGEQLHQGVSGSGVSESFQPRQLASPNELYGFPGTESILTVYGHENTFRVGREHYDQQERFKGLFDPDPYHLGPAAGRADMNHHEAGSSHAADTA